MPEIESRSSESVADLFGEGAAHPLDFFFRPRSVAVIGASERSGSVGRSVLWNLVSSPFGGTVFPVNDKHSNVLGIKAYPSVAALPEPVELALVVTPAKAVPDVIRECAAARMRGAVVISAGFKETGEEGARLEREVLEIARGARMRILGPNCLGVMNPSRGLNATFAGSMARPGSVAFLSQSGALQTAILDWSLEENIGFSAFVSLGSMVDVGWGDLIDYLGNDEHTRSILIYMESIGNARAFLSAAREVTLRKPIIVIKGGRTAQAARAAASHTGTLTGNDEVLTCALRRAGVVRVDTIADLFYMADTLGKQPRPLGPRLCIVSNAGGPGVLATDTLVRGGGDLAALSEDSRGRLDKALPPAWSGGNPIDILGDADPERYAQALEIAGEDKGVDGLLMILTPQDQTEPTLTAQRLKVYAHKYRSKPLLASWMGGAELAAGRRILADAGIPNFQYPDTAARIFNYMWRYSYNLRALYETPTLADPASVGGEQVAATIAAARGQGRTLLSELESKRVLQSYGIPTVDTRLAASADEAARQAEAIGFPVVLKLHSRTITHKTDVGGVHLNLWSLEAVRRAYAAIRERLEQEGRGTEFEGVTVQPMVQPGGYELILGSSIDPQFGPVLLFGTGGILVEAFDDHALALPPLNTTLARRMMEQTRIHQVLSGVRGRLPVDVAELEKLVVRFSQLVVEQRAIQEIEINPLSVSATRLVALDARIVLHPPELTEADLPLPAIPPYPTRYVEEVKLKSGAPLRVRPIRPEDEPKMVAFHRTLSEQSVYMRYAGVLKLDQRVAHERLSRMCFIDYDREMALVAERTRDDGDTQLLAVARLRRLTGSGDAEFALLVSDALQGHGLGHILLTRLIEIGRDWGVQRIVAEILRDNVPMRRVCRDLGFSFEGGGGTGATLALSPKARAV